MTERSKARDGFVARLERHQASVAHVRAAMRRGASLHLHYANGRALWRLSNGPFVSGEVAKAVTAHHDVIPAGNTLFAGLPSRTWRLAGAPRPSR